VSSALTFVVLAAPVPKARARVVSGHAYTPKRVREYEAAVAAAAREAVAAMPSWRTDGPMSVRLAVFRGARRGDLENYSKAICDAMNGVVYDDDRQIVEMHLVVGYCKQRPHAVVIVEPAVPRMEAAA
jgi:Holliday junction resolvase RusA-like endonuclease